jgi:hypothetical protein
MASLSINPLSTVSDKQLKEACVALWDWPWCHNCDGKLVCTTITCSAFHSTRLSPFFDFYKQTTQGYVPELSNSGDAALRKHEDLIDIITYLRKNPNKRRDKATIDFFEARAQKENIARVPNARDQARAFNLAVRVLTMVNCAAENQAGAMLESGTQPVTWSNDATLNEFISKTFPTTDYPELNDLSQTKRSIYIKESLQGKRLQKMTGLAFKGTDDLRNHLKFDTDEGIIEVFTHTRFLKERLASTKDMEEALIG